jgi:TolB-like protein
MCSANGLVPSRRASVARQPCSQTWLRGVLALGGVCSCAAATPEAPALVAVQLPADAVVAQQTPALRPAFPPLPPLRPPPPSAQSEGLVSVLKAAGRAAEAIRRAHARSIAVLDIRSLDGNHTMLGRFLAEEITTVVLKNRGVAVVEQRLISALTREAEVAEQRPVDDRTAAEVGTRAGAEAVLVGTITEFGPTLRLNVRVIRTRTGEIQGAEQAILMIDAPVKKLWEQSPVEPDRRARIVPIVP